jgi:hypothetical protein
MSIVLLKGDHSKRETTETYVLVKERRQDEETSNKVRILSTVRICVLDFIA